ncbi:helix-turn-helix domain-containing protein [Nocardia sp. NPDC046473]|uniref:helix-turn-helix domain-containing protein n=1 Tax=Nocardia sp. NPDC046473 TaxID=3155733 RepID=UPI0033EDD308
MSTERNAMAWEWLAQQKGAPIETVAELCGVSRPRIYELVRQWRRAGFVETARMPSQGPNGSWSTSLWVWPTRETGWAFLGFDPGPWFPRVTTVAHVRALAELRLRLTGTALDPLVWTSERLLRHRDPGLREAGRRYLHVHDAEFSDSSGVRWALEAELTRKKGADRLATVVRTALEAARTRELAGVVYFVRGSAVRAGIDAAVRSLAEAGAAELLQSLDVRDLDEFLTAGTSSEEVS